jgi:hypothetical protein
MLKRFLSYLKYHWCLTWHQGFNDFGYMKEESYYICSKCYMKLSKITGDKLHYEAEND